MCLMSDTPKPLDFRCDYCFEDGTCDKVAQRFGWCGAVKLAQAIEAHGVYALKQPSPDGGEWIQEHDSLEAALRYQAHSGGVLVRREQLLGQPGLWWVEVAQEVRDV